MQNWMQVLATHYEWTRTCNPEEPLLVVFDIDGTIFDRRYLLRYLLQFYDCHHSTRHSVNLTLQDLAVPENRLHRLLQRHGLAADEIERIEAFYRRHRWSSKALLEAHRPYRGVLGIIRWFQMQPGTEVALNSGRPEGLRLVTLRSLNALGEEYRVRFRSDLLHLNPNPEGCNVARAKIDGIHAFRAAGYRVVAVVDNEPVNLAAVTEANPGTDILPLHANTLFESKRMLSPQGTVRGHSYDLTALVTGRRLPQHVQLVWCGLDNERELQRFLAAEVHWAECTVRRNPLDGALYARQDAIPLTPVPTHDPALALPRLLESLRKRRRRLRLDLSAQPELLEATLELLGGHGMAKANCWFAGTMDGLQARGFKRLAHDFPDAIIECRVDFLASLVTAAPDYARDLIAMLQDWGVNRFGVAWSTPHKSRLLDLMDRCAAEVHITGVPDLQAFLQASLLQPRSIGSMFDFQLMTTERRSIPSDPRHAGVLSGRVGSMTALGAYGRGTRQYPAGIGGLGAVPDGHSEDVHRFA